jgi:hypothetical protein
MHNAMFVNDSEALACEIAAPGPSRNAGAKSDDLESV